MLSLNELLFSTFFALCLLEFSASLSPKILLGTYYKKLGQDNQNSIELACHAAQFPELCKSSLARARIGGGAGPEEVISAGLEQCFNGTKNSYAQCQELLNTSNNINFTTSVGTCLEQLQNAERYITKSMGAPLGERIKDIEAWMSSALTWQSDCNNSFKYLLPSKQVYMTMTELSSVVEQTSNILSMIDALDIYGKNMSLWKPPVTERSKSKMLVLHPFYNSKKISTHHAWSLMDATSSVIADIIVSKDDASSMSIQEAINKVPSNSDKRFVIHVKAGVYEEIVRVPPEKTNIMLVGDGMDQTVITGSLKVPSLPGRVTTYGSATFAVNADGFIAKGICFQNTAGLPTNQAVALRVSGDLAAFYNCAILGNQDSLYTHTLRQFYKNCRIEGNVDFIFGNSAAVFENCLILVRPRQDKKPSNFFITAQGRTDPAQNTGLVFNNCTVNGTDEFTRELYGKPTFQKAYLGRPWKMYSRTIYMNSYLGELVNPEGWYKWTGDFALNTLFYGEYHNNGPGALYSKRVPWCSLVPDKNAEMYSPKNFVNSDEWLPST